MNRKEVSSHRRRAPHVFFISPFECFPASRRDDAAREWRAPVV
nr:MAG TPA: hypothetical protein [Caudoviricetes sp.]